MIIPKDILLSWYSNGIFPMADDDGVIGLYSPDPRGIIDLDSFRITSSLRKKIASGRFELKINTVFEDVIHACADREETWLSPDIIESYISLHRLGHAHSVEAWRENMLVGGLYGVSMGKAFFGESMFHDESDASKVSLEALVRRMRDRGMTLLDTQYITPHLAQFGAVEIAKHEYLERLAEALDSRDVFYP